MINLQEGETLTLTTLNKYYYKEKSLVPHPYAQHRFKLRVGEGYWVEGLVEVRGSWVPLAACPVVGKGRPHWFVHGVSLRLFEEDLEWRWIERVRSGWQAELSELLQFETLYPDAPPIEGIPVGAIAQTPLLKLSDPRGAFADLCEQDGERVSVCNGGEWEADLLETDYVKKRVGESHYYCPLDRVAKSLTFLLECGWRVEDYRGREVFRAGEAQIEMEVEGAAVGTCSRGVALSLGSAGCKDLSLKEERIALAMGDDCKLGDLRPPPLGERYTREHVPAVVVSGTLSYDEHKADVSDVVGAFNRREQFVELGSGVGLLPEGGPWEGMATGEVEGGKVRFKRSAVGHLREVMDSEGVSYDAALGKLKGEGVLEAKAHPNFGATLRPYQQEGLQWLSFLHQFGFGGILADDMGLGKTVQVLAHLSTRGGRHLICLPTSLVFNWKREIGRFLPGARLTVHHGAERGDLPEEGIILTTYGTVRQDLPLFRETAFDSLVLDEAQGIKNPDSQIAQAVSQIRAPYRLCVTGTPVENRLEELWSHFHFLMPDLLGERAPFLARAKAADADLRYLRQIQKEVAPFILRRKKEEVAADLPEKVELVEWVEMGEGQRSVYDEQLRVARTKGKKIEVLEALLRLRQVCCHPALIGEEGGSAKLERLLADLEELVAEGKKVLIYSQFTSMLNLIQREWGRPVLRLDGSTQDRERVVAKFQEDRDEQVFLISLKAGGVGLNLTKADYVLLYDPWWNVSAENQAIDRAHRIGREGKVIAKRYVCAESVEEKMMTLKGKKQSLGEGVLEEMGRALSGDELQALLSNLSFGLSM